jgi:hypothetical protein
LTVAGVSSPAGATPVTSSNITSPTSGFHYLHTDANSAYYVLVQGTSNGTTGSVDIRCYSAPGLWIEGASATVGPTGAFAAQVSTDSFYGTCVLRAVPSGWPVGNSVASFTGPKVTGEQIISRKVTSGPNTGKVVDYHATLVSSHAMNKFFSAGGSGLADSHLQYADGSSSYSLWSGDAWFNSYEQDANRSSLRVDGHNAYGPYSAFILFITPAGLSADNPGLPQVTYHVSRNASSGVITTHETDPIVVCPSDTFPATKASCPKFISAGVRLERTIVIDDGGRQVHISDVWRSTDGKAHGISPHYNEAAEGIDYSAGTEAPVPLGIKMQWMSCAYTEFAGTPTSYPSPAKVPATIYIHDRNSAADGDTLYPRGAFSTDYRPSEVRRVDNSRFILHDEGLKIPAGGSRLIRQAFVMATTQSVVDAKAAAIARRINPWRADALIRTGGASTFSGNNVYNTTGTHQSVGVHAHRGASATFYLKVQNDGTQNDSFKVKGPGSPAGFSVHYYAGTTNITSAVTNGSYTLTNLAPRAVRSIRLVVTVHSSAAIGAVRSWLLTATSTHDGTRKDAAKATVTVA